MVHLLPESSSKAAKSSEDRLSVLPQEVLLKILSLTKSYKTAAKCSLISKSWMNLYNRLPVLYLSQSDLMRGEPNPNSRTRRKQRHEAKLRFQNRLAMALFRHSAELETFSFEAAGPDQIIWDQCMRFVGKPNLKNLSLCNSESDENPDPPELLSVLTSLESLSLIGFKLLQCHHGRSFQGFGNLRVLELKKLCNWDSSAVEKLIISCPVLEEISVTVPCKKVDSGFRVSSQSLQKFEFGCCDPRCYEPEKHVQIDVTVDAVSLVEMRVPSMNLRLHVDGGMPEVLTQCLAEARWRNGEMIFLEARNVREDAEFLGNVGAFCCLSKLKLSHVKVSPLDLWGILARLPWLQELSLAVCKFEWEVDGLADICDTDDYKGYLQCSLIKQQQRINVERITVTGYTSTLSEGFQIFLCLVLQKAPLLDCLYCNFTNYGQYKMSIDMTDEFNWKYARFVEGLMSAKYGAAVKRICGDYVQYAVYERSGNLKVLNITQDPIRTCFQLLSVQNAILDIQGLETYDFFLH